MTFQNEFKKGSAETLILALLEDCPRHGYQIAKLIEQRSRGELEFHVASLYPLLHRLEQRRWVAGSKYPPRRETCQAIHFGVF